MKVLVAGLDQRVAAEQRVKRLEGTLRPLCDVPKDSSGRLGFDGVLGSKLSQEAYEGLRALLNFVGSDIIFTRAHYADRAVTPTTCKEMFQFIAVVMAFGPSR